MNKYITFFSVSVIALAASLPFQNCGVFGINQSAKFNLISNVQVFENGQNLSNTQETFDDLGGMALQETFDNGSGMIEGFDNGSGNNNGNNNQTDNGFANNNGNNNQTDNGFGNNNMEETFDNGGRLDPEVLGPNYGFDDGIEFPPMLEETDGGSGTNPNNGGQVVAGPDGNNGMNQNDGGSGRQLTLFEILTGAPNDGSNGTDGGAGNLVVNGPNGTDGGGGTPGSPMGGDRNPANINVSFPNETAIMPGVVPVVDNNGNEQERVNRMPVIRLCTDYRLSKKKSKKKVISRVPMVMARRLEVVVKSADGSSTLCHINNTAEIKNMVLYKKSIDLSSCAEPIVTPFQISMFADGFQGNNLFNKDPRPGQEGKPKLIEKGDLNEGTFVLFLENSKIGHLNFENFIDADFYKVCDKNASPLFVDFRNDHEKEKGYALSAPWHGVWFDIWGENSIPVKHQKKKISWFNDDRMAFLVLPDQYGNVNGINEMFGDNTRGPDGRFAINGFKALEKYDGLRYEGSTLENLRQFYHRMPRTPDGVIDDQDDVYHDLRLWKDKDSDGVAEAGELISLKTAGVKTIDLVYDPNFKEKDEYGNVVKYKSVVQMDDGSLNLVFDIWFRVDSF